MTCDDATWLDLKSEYDLSAMLRALASKGGSSYTNVYYYKKNVFENSMIFWFGHFQLEFGAETLQFCSTHGECKSSRINMKAILLLNPVELAYHF